MKAKDTVGLQEAMNLAILGYVLNFDFDFFFLLLFSLAYIFLSSPSLLNGSVPSLKVRALDRDMFPNGFVGFLEASPTRKKFDTIAYHFHFKFHLFPRPNYFNQRRYKLNWAEPVGKLNRARELLHWHLDPIER